MQCIVLCFLSISRGIAVMYCIVPSIPPPLRTSNSSSLPSPSLHSPHSSSSYPTPPRPSGSLAALEQKTRVAPQRNPKPGVSSHPINLEKQILSPRGSITPLVVLPRTSQQSKQQSPFGLRRPVNDGTALRSIS